MIPIIQKTRITLAEMFPLWAKPKPLTRTQEEFLARQWGRLNFHAVVRHVPKGSVFVHCHECRWPVTPGRYGMLHGLGPSHIPATEEQMQRICEGVRRQMGAV